MQTECVGIECRDSAHPTKVAYVGVLGRRQGSREVIIWPFQPVSMTIMQAIDGRGDEFPWQAVAPDGTVHPDARALGAEDRARVRMECPLCGLALTRRWPDARLALAINGALDRGVSTLPLAALVATLT